MVSHQGVLSLGWHLIRAGSPKDVLSSEWCLIRVVSQNGLSSRWSLIRVMSQQGVLSLVGSLYYTCHHMSQEGHVSIVKLVCCGLTEFT